MEKAQSYWFKTRKGWVQFGFLYFLFGFQTLFASKRELKFDVLIYSASPAGISAAIHASRQGLSVGIVEPSKSISFHEFTFVHSKCPEIRTGFYKEITDSVQKLVFRKYSTHAPDSLFLEKCYRRVIRALLKKNSVNVLFGFVPDSSYQVQLKNKRLPALVWFSSSKRGEKKVSFSARFFIDASRSGDLMTRFPCRYQKGRGSNSDWDMKIGDLDAEFSSNKTKPQFSENSFRLDGLHWLTMKELRTRNSIGVSNGSAVSIGVGRLGENSGNGMTIPFGIMVSKNLVPVLFPGPVSASFLVFRLMSHPVNQMVLGQVAGLAASECLRMKIFPNQISIDSLQLLLIRNRFELIYLSDVDPVSDPDFAVFQKLALLNCFPSSQVGLANDWQNSDFQFLADRTGFSSQELIELTKGKTKRNGLRAIWMAWENASKGQL